MRTRDIHPGMTVQIASDRHSGDRGSTGGFRVGTVTSITTGGRRPPVAVHVTGEIRTLADVTLIPADATDHVGVGDVWREWTPEVADLVPRVRADARARHAAQIGPCQAERRAQVETLGETLPASLIPRWAPADGYGPISLADLVAIVAAARARGLADAQP